MRARMLVFVQQMLFYATAEVIEPNWQKLMAKVDDAELGDNDTVETKPTLNPRTKRTVDELMQDHLDMLDSCMKDLGLTQGKLLRIHSKLMTGCSMFATYTASLTKSLGIATQELASETNKVPSNKANASLEYDPARLGRMDETLKRYEDHFNRHLKILIDSLNYYAATETVVLLGLCARLQFAEAQKRDDLLL